MSGFNSKLVLTAILLFMVMAIGCGTTSHHQISKPIQTGTNVYSIAELADIDNYVPQTFDNSMLNKLKDRLIAAVREDSNRFDQINGVSDLAIDTYAKNVIVFKPTIVGYEPGSGAKRFWVGFGAGKSVLQMKVDLYDKSNGEMVGSIILTSEAMQAGTNVYRPMAQQFVAFIERYL